MKKILFLLSFIIITLTINAQEKNTETKPANQWSMITNYGLKGPNGQIVINLPAQATMLCMIALSGQPKNLYTWHGSMTKEFAPGNYDLTFWNLKIPVIVEKGKDTRIYTGVLNSTVKKPWEVWTTDGTKVFSTGSAKMVALPVGKYIIKTSGTEIKTTINDGKITIFSFTNY